LSCCQALQSLQHVYHPEKSNPDSRRNRKCLRPQDIAASMQVAGRISSNLFNMEHFVANCWSTGWYATSWLQLHPRHIKVPDMEVDASSQTAEKSASQAPAAVPFLTCSSSSKCVACSFHTGRAFWIILKYAI
jgi:hypothetical protein